jgi:hypothetical protein
LFVWDVVAFHATDCIIAPVVQSALNCLECFAIYAIKYTVYITLSGSITFTVTEVEKAFSIEKMPNQQVTQK